MQNFKGNKTLHLIRLKSYFVSGIKKWDNHLQKRRKALCETFHSPRSKLIQRSLSGGLYVCVDHLRPRKQVPLSSALIIKPARNEVRFLNQGNAFIIISNILKQKGSHFSPFVFTDRNPPSLHDPAPK